MRLPVHLVNLVPHLPAPVEIAVYRVVQELLNNVKKHAQTTELEMHVTREGTRFAVSMENNGQDFEPAALANQPLAGTGLAGVRNRVALLGGALLIFVQLGAPSLASGWMCAAGSAVCWCATCPDRPKNPRLRVVAK